MEKIGLGQRYPQSKSKTVYIRHWMGSRKIVDAGHDINYLIWVLSLLEKMDPSIYADACLISVLKS